MSDASGEPWDQGKIVKRNLKARAFRKVEKREIREVEIEVVRAPLVRAPPPSPPMAPPQLKPALAKDAVRETPPQTIPVAHLAATALAAATSGATASGSTTTPAVAAGAVVRETQKPGARSVESAALPSSASAAGPRMDHGSVHGALLAIADALYRDVGHPGTILQTPKGVAFSVRHDIGAGEVRTMHTVTVPLPEGHSTSHQSAIAIELENRAHLVLDIVPSTASLADLKAHAFDALQFRRNSRCFTALVFIRIPGPGLVQEQAERVAHGYDLFFGIEEEHARTEQRYAALRSRVGTWLSAAAKA